jgi:HAD superfamily hydrolase (TIGR01490 family)
LAFFFNMSIEQKQIAFFDIDKTILRINSGEALIRHAYSKGLMSTIGILKAIYTGLQYKFGWKDTHKLILKMGSWLKGLSEEKFNRLSNEIFHKDILPNIRPNILKEINRLQEIGVEVVILSSAVKSICQPLGDHLKVDSVICTELEVRNGLFTGMPVGKFCFRDEKLIRLKEYCEDKNYNLKDVAYYADSIDDLPALEKVGYPVCIAPDKKLTRIALEKGWQIHRW